AAGSCQGLASANVTASSTSIRPRESTRSMASITSNGLLVEVDHVLADQFVENIVIEPDTVASARAFNVFEEIDRRIAGVTYRAIPDSPNDLLELLLLPGAIARVRKRHYLFHEIIKAVDLGRSSSDDSFQSRNNFVYRYFLDAVFVVGFGIRLVPPVSCGLLISGTDECKTLVGILISLSRRSRISVVFQRLAAVGGGFSL